MLMISAYYCGRLMSGICDTHERARAAEPWLADQLQRLASERPHLQTLVALLGDEDVGFALTDAFLLAFATHPATDKSILLRPLFTDQRAHGRTLLTVPIARRIVAYLRSLPAQPLLTGHCAREDIPKPLARWFGSERERWAELSAPLVRELWALAVDGSEPVPPNGDPYWPHQAWAELRPLLDARLLGADAARNAAQDGYSAPFARYYFETPIDALSVRNQMQALHAVLALRKGGKEQNSIPLQWSRRFDLQPRSVPDTLAMLDVLALVYGRVTTLDDDPRRVGDLFNQPVLGGHAAFWGPVVATHRVRTLVGPTESEGSGMFDSSLKFNVARATGLHEGRVARLAPFAAYYQNIDPDRLLATCMPVWAAISDANARRCAALRSHPDATPAIRIRDLGNILSLRGREGSELQLPSVAKYALGAREPVSHGTATGFTRRRGGTTPAKRFEPLEKLIRQLDGIGSDD